MTCSILIVYKVPVCIEYIKLCCLTWMMVRKTIGCFGPCMFWTPKGRIISVPSNSFSHGVCYTWLFLPVLAGAMTSEVRGPGVGGGFGDTDQRCSAAWTCLISDLGPLFIISSNGSAQGIKSSITSPSPCGLPSLTPPSHPSVLKNHFGPVVWNVLGTKRLQTIRIALHGIISHFNEDAAELLYSFPFGCEYKLI